MIAGHLFSLEQTVRVMETEHAAKQVHYRTYDSWPGR
jgi:hypothetical protein